MSLVRRSPCSARKFRSTALCPRLLRPKKRKTSWMMEQTPPQMKAEPPPEMVAAVIRPGAVMVAVVAAVSLARMAAADDRAAVADQAAAFDLAMEHLAVPDPELVAPEVSPAVDRAEVAETAA